jgi:Stress responsive A/B Barrel Domain
MFISLRLITLPPEREAEKGTLAARLKQAAATLPGVRSCWIAPVSPVAVINAGHVVWRMSFACEREALAVTRDPAWRGAVAGLLGGAEVGHVGYRVTRSAVRPADGGIWRALVFRIMPHGFPQGARVLENGLLLMPGHVSTIRSWALSPVSLCEGPKAFTHVWEQEFDSLEGLTGEYMTHPVHWGMVDAFFDAECPEYIVDPHLIQVVGAIDRTIME